MSDSTLPGTTKRLTVEPRSGATANRRLHGPGQLARFTSDVTSFGDDDAPTKDQS